MSGGLDDYDYDTVGEMLNNISSIREDVAVIAKAAQHSVQRTAIAAGGLCGIAGFIIGWLVFGG